MALRVNLYGNNGHMAYVLAKFLRRAGVDARLFLERGFPFLPEHEDPELKGNYPDWIHLTGDLRWRRYGLFDRGFVRRLAECDLIHTYYYGPVWARKTGRPFVFQTYGGDLNVLPFMTDSLHHRYLALLQQRGIRMADRVFLPNPNNVYSQEAIRRLQLRRVEFFPHPIDANKFRPLDDAIVRKLRSRYDSEWILFHPTRQIWTEASFIMERKGNDLLFRAFARFLRDTGCDATLIAVRHGSDFRSSEKLVRDLGIERSVHWISPVHRRELVELYNLADIVLDQFTLGAYGGCAFEAWACGKPVFMYLKSLQGFYREDPPLINVRTEGEIYRKLVEYRANPEALRVVGEMARRWALENQHGDVVVKRYISVYEEILDEHRSK